MFPKVCWTLTILCLIALPFGPWIGARLYDWHAKREGIKRTKLFYANLKEKNLKIEKGEEYVP